MTIELFLAVTGKVAMGMIWTVLCAFLVSVVAVYAFKYGRSLIKNADQNIEKFKNVKVFKEEKLKRQAQK